LECLISASCSIGHGGWVTALAVGEEVIDGETVEFLLSGSRDKTLIKWDLNWGEEFEEDSQFGKPKKMMTGHSHFISQVKLTSNSNFAFSSSWDGTCRLWNMKNGRTISKLIGHEKDVFHVDLSPDDRQIITGGLDKKIKIWNTRSECKHTVETNSHTDAVSCVRFYQAKQPALCVTASWDKTIKVWNNTYMSLMYTFKGHTAQVTTLDIVENSNYLASGSRDGKIMVWDISEGKWCTSMDCDSPVNTVLFSPKLYWLVIATEKGIKVLNLPNQQWVQADIKATSKKANESNSDKLIACKSLCWNKSGSHLYSGWSDNFIRVYKIDNKLVSTE